MVTTVALIVLIICLIGLWRNTHKFILSYSVGSILLQGWLCIRFQPPALTVAFMVNFMLMIYYLIHIKHYPLKGHPLKTSIILFILMKSLSFLSGRDIISLVPAFFAILCQIPLIIMVYHEIKSNDDITWIIKSIIFVFLILGGYAIIEYYLQINPIFQLLVFTIPRDFLLGKIFYYGMDLSGNFGIRFGSVRCSSLMPIHITLGAVSVLFFELLMFFRERFINIMKEWIWWLLVALSVFCLFITGSRTPYVFFVIVALPFFFKEMNVKVRLLGILGCCVVCIIFGNILNEIILSIIDTENVNGSNVEMRQSQFDAVINVIQDDFLFGLGIKGYNDALAKKPEILGAESVWFQTLISGGIVGVILLVCIYWSMLRIMIKHSPHRRIYSTLCFVLGYVALVSASTTPGLEITYIFTLLIILIRNWQINVNKGRLT